MIVIIITSLLVIGCIVYGNSKKASFDASSIAFACAIIISVFLFFELAFLFTCRAGAYSMIAERDSLQQSFTELRKNVSTHEMATVGKEIAQWNADLAKAKYWNDTIWDIYWPDEIMYVEPIK